MIRLSRNIGIAIILLVMFFVWGRLNSWWTARNYSFEMPIFKTDTLKFYYPTEIDKPSLWDKFKTKKKTPDVIQPVEFPDFWYKEGKEITTDSLWRAITLTKNKDRVRVVVVKNDSVYAHTFCGVKDDFIWWASDNYYEGYILQTRFDNPIRWSGILIGCQLGYSDNVVILPYVKTGVNISRLTVYAGADREKIFMEGSFRLW